jgi:hypothetical protein
MQTEQVDMQHLNTYCHVDPVMTAKNFIDFRTNDQLDIRCNSTRIQQLYIWKLAD